MTQNFGLSRLQICKHNPNLETQTTIIELIIVSNANPKRGNWFTKQIAKPVFTHELSVSCEAGNFSFPKTL